MRKPLLLIALISALLPVKEAHAQFPSASDPYIRCSEYVSKQDYEEQYELGKAHAFLFQQALLRKDWNTEERKSLNFKAWVDSRHGTLGLTGAALTLIGMASAKAKGEVFDASSDTMKCQMGQFSVYSETPWSGLHSGFEDHLSPELRSYYWSLPEQ